MRIFDAVQLLQRLPGCVVFLEMEYRESPDFTTYTLAGAGLFGVGFDGVSGFGVTGFGVSGFGVAGAGVSVSGASGSTTGVLLP